MEMLVSFLSGLAGVLCAIILYHRGYNRGLVLGSMRKRDERDVGGVEKGEILKPFKPDPLKARLYRNKLRSAVNAQGELDATNSNMQGM